MERLCWLIWFVLLQALVQLVGYTFLIWSEFNV